VKPDISLRAALEWHPRRRRWRRLHSRADHWRCYDGTAYDGYRANLSTAYISSYIQRAGQGCPTLSSLEPQVMARIIQQQVNSVKRNRRTALLLLAASVAWLALSFRISSDASLALLLAYITVLSVTFYSWNRKQAEAAAVKILFVVVRELESNPNCWSSLTFRAHVCAHLSKIADLVEQIPLQIRAASPGVRHEVVRAAQNKAQAIRDLELWALWPGPFTFTDLVQRLARNLCILGDGRWYELPETPYQGRMVRAQRAALVAASLLVLAASIVVIQPGAHLFGPAVYLVSTVLAAVAVALLNYAGIPSSLIDRSASAGADMTNLLRH
jgi:hypothetical protein